MLLSHFILGNKKLRPNVLNLKFLNMWLRGRCGRPKFVCPKIVVRNCVLAKLTIVQKKMFA